MKNDSCSNANRMKVFALAALSGMALTVHAVDFPSASGDIALAEDWGAYRGSTSSIRYRAPVPLLEDICAVCARF